MTEIQGKSIKFLVKLEGNLRREVKRFSNRLMWPWKASRLWIFVLNRTDSQILKAEWIVVQLWILTRIPGSACLDVRILDPKWNLEHGSLFSLGRYDWVHPNYFFFPTKLFSDVIEIVLCYSHQACCLLSCLCKINNGIPFYLFIFEVSHFYFQIWLLFQIWTQIFADRPISIVPFIFTLLFELAWVRSFSSYIVFCWVQN